MIKAYDAWKSIRLKHISKTIGQYGANLSAGNYLENGVRFLRTTDIQENGEIIVADKGAYVEKSLVRDYLLEPDDILFSRSGTLGRSYLHTDDTIGDFAFAGYLVRFRLNHLVHPKFIFYVSKSSEFSALIEANAIQSTISNFNGEKYGNIEILIPSLETQKLITTFLDSKTAAIDTLIDKKQRLIQLLEEKRTALINQAVTKGLNPNVPMKDSGIPWIGKIPEHWEIYHLNRVVKKFVDYRGKTPEKTKFGVPLITAGAIRHGEIDHSRAPEWVSEEVYLEIIKRGIPEVGDLLFTSEAPLGEVAIILDPEIALAQRVILFKVDKTKINSMFLKLHFLSLSGQGEIKSRASGSTAEGIRADRLKMSIVPTPPLEEQLIINSYVEERIKPHKIIAKKINSQIEKLQEYRRSLITAAVTGKIEMLEVKEKTAV